MFGSKTKLDMFPVYTTIALNMNLSSKDDIISLIISQIIIIFENRNVSYYSQANNILLSLINGVKIHFLTDTKEGILITGKLFLKEENFQKIYLHHINDNFAILKDSGKQRITLYKSLGKIVFLVMIIFLFFN